MPQLGAGSDGLGTTADPGPATQLGLAGILSGHFTYTIPHGTALVLTQVR